jgi:cytosine/adenosine deaminase-related metal-dependent hydrolase
MILRSGIAAVPALHRHGVPLAMGLDGFTVDDDDDGFRELRLNYMLHRGVALDDGIPLAAWYNAACHGGRRVVTGEDWPIATGAPADFLVLDYAAMSGDVSQPVAENRIIAQRATARHIESLVVAGREIVRDGRVLGVDLDGAQAELDAQVRHAAPEFRDWLGFSAKLRQRLGGFYAAGLHRCG